MTFSQFHIQQALAPTLHKTNGQATSDDIRNWIKVAKAWLWDVGDSEEDIEEAFRQMIEDGIIVLVKGE